MKKAGQAPVATARLAFGILGKALERFRRHGCFHLAAAIAFFALLSFIPLAVLLLSFATLVIRSSENLTDRLFEALQTYFPVVPPAFIQQVGDLVQHAGTLGGLSSVFLLITAIMMFDAIQNGLNRVFESEKRTFVRSRLVSLVLAVVTCASMGLIVAFTGASAAVGGLIGGLEPLDGVATIVYKFVITHAVPLLVTAVVFTVAIKGVPNKHVGLRPALIAGLFGAVLWEVAKLLFTWYVSTIAPYHVIYGSLGALIIGLLWIQYSASLLLLSGELAAVLNDGTEGESAAFRKTLARRA